MFRKAILIVLLLPLSAFAQQPAPADADAEDVKSIVVKTVAADPSTPEAIPPLADGIYFLVVKSGQPSQISAVRTAVVVGPTPPGPNPPGPSPLTDFGKAIKAAADKATGDTDRVNTAQGLAMLYRTISAEAHKKDTTATLDSIINTTIFATDKTLTTQGAAAVAAWGDMRTLLRTTLTDALRGDGTTSVVPVSKLGDILDQAAAGLEASAPKTAEKAPSPAFWDFLLKLLEQLLPLLLNLK